MRIDELKDVLEFDIKENDIKVEIKDVYKLDDIVNEGLNYFNITELDTDIMLSEVTEVNIKRRILEYLVIQYIVYNLGKDLKKNNKYRVLLINNTDYDRYIMYWFDNDENDDKVGISNGVVFDRVIRM